MQQYNEWQFSTDPIRRMREMTLFLENALISHQYATTSSLSELERQLSFAQYLRQLERIACSQMTITEYIASARPVPMMAYCPIIPV